MERLYSAVCVFVFSEPDNVILRQGSGGVSPIITWCQSDDADSEGGAERVLKDRGFNYSHLSHVGEVTAYIEKEKAMISVYTCWSFNVPNTLGLTVRKLPASEEVWEDCFLGELVHPAHSHVVAEALVSATVEQQPEMTW